MPGFVDAHVHLSMVPGDPETQRSRFAEEHVLETASVLRTTLLAGVTTARDLDGLTPGYRDAIARGSAVGPRLHLAISMLSPTGGHADPVRPNGSLPAWAVRPSMPTPGVVDTDDDVIRTVRELMRMGADAIKVSTSGGVGSPTDDPADAGLPVEHVRLVARLTAERGGRPITAHALTDAAVRVAVLGGAASIEHGYDLSDETIELMLQHGTVLVPTLSTLLRNARPGDHVACCAGRPRGAAEARARLACAVPLRPVCPSPSAPMRECTRTAATSPNSRASSRSASTRSRPSGRAPWAARGCSDSTTTSERSRPGKQGDLVVTRRWIRCSASGPRRRRRRADGASGRARGQGPRRPGAWRALTRPTMR